MTRPLAGDLVEVLAVNSPDAFQYRHSEATRALGSDAELWAAGRRNAIRLMGTLDRERLNADVEWVQAPESDLGSSLLLSPAFCADAPVALVRGRGLLLTDAASAAGVDALEQAAAESDDPTDPATLIECRGGALAAR